MLYALRYLFIIVFILLVFSFSKKDRVEFLPAMFLIGLTGLLMSNAGLRIKPELFSFLLMTITVWVWLRIKTQPDKAWPLFYFFPILTLIWVNSHGGFIFGILFLDLVLIGEVLNWIIGSSEKLDSRFRKHLFISIILSNLALFITPYGMRYPIQLINNLVINPEEFKRHMITIAEYQSIFFPQASHFHFIDYMIVSSGILIILMIAQLRRNRIDWALLLVNTSFLIIYIKYMRVTYFWAVIFVFSSSYLIRKVSQDKSELFIIKPLKIAINSITFILLLFFSIRLQYETYCMPSIGFNINYISPIQEASFIRMKFPYQNIGNDYYCGSYLLWSLWPNKKIFIDARYFPYHRWYDEEHEFEKGKDKATIEVLLKKYNCDLWCLSYDTPVFQYFIASPEWRLVYYGPSACIFLSNRIDLSQQTRSIAESIYKVGIYQAYTIMKFALAVGDLEVAKNIVKAMKPNPLCPLQIRVAINAKLSVGNNLLSHREYNDAIGVYSDAIMIVQDYPLINHFWGDDIYTDLAMIHQNLGYSLQSVNQISAATKEYTDALKLNPDLVNAQKNLHLLITQMTKIDASISKLEYVLTYSPNDLKVLNSLAVYYSMKGQYDRAIDYLMKELSISPENPRIYYNLACIYSRQNRLIESRNFLDKAIKKGFNDWDQLRKDHDLDKLRYTTYFDNLLKNH